MEHITKKILMLTVALAATALALCGCSETADRLKTDYQRYTQLADAHFYNGNIDSALVYHRYALSVASNDVDKVGAYLNIASTLYYKGEVADAEKIANNCLDHINDIKQTLDVDMQRHKLRAYVILAELYNEQERYADAVRQFILVSNLAKHLGDVEKEVQSILYIAEREEKAGNFTSAIEGYNDALDVAEKDGAINVIFNIYSHLQDAYFKFGDIKQSQKYLNLMRKRQQSNSLLQRCMVTIADLRLSLVLDDEASQYQCVDQLLYFEGEQDRSAIELLNLNGVLSDYYISNKDYKNACKYLQRLEDEPSTDEVHKLYVQMKRADVSMLAGHNAEALQQLKSIDENHLRRSDISLYEQYLHQTIKCYKLLGDQRHAYDCNQRLFSVRDSLKVESHGHTLAYRSMVMKRDTTMLSQRLRIMEQQTEINEAHFRRNMLVYTMVLLIFAVGIMALVFYLHRVKGRRRTIIRQNRKLRYDVEAYREKLNLQAQELTEKSNFYAREHNYAAYLQRKNLSPESIIEEVKCITEHFIYYAPCNASVGGDFYWFKRSADKLFICCGDATGHGVPGALIAMICYTGLNDIVRSVPDISALELVNRLDDNLHRTLYTNNINHCCDSVDLSLMCIDLNTKQISMVLARQVAFIVSAGGDVVDVVGVQRSIGDKEEKFAQRNYSEQNIALRPTDTIYLTTDGFASQLGGIKQRTFKRRNVRSTLVDIRSNPLIFQKSIIAEKIRSWRGEMPQTDDILVIGLKVDVSKL